MPEDQNKQAPVPQEPKSTQGQKDTSLPQSTEVTPEQPAAVPVDPNSVVTQKVAGGVDLSEDVPEELHQYRDVDEGVQARVATAEEKERRIRLDRTSS